MMNYQKRILKALDFIGAHFDTDLTLDEICKVACFSKYHFHRLFTIHTGMSLSSYIKWLKLKRAAHQLTIYNTEPVINIALEAGFESHTAFGRAFKKVCGQSPKDFRKNPQWKTWEQTPYLLHPTGAIPMNVTIKEIPSRRLAVMSHIGDPLKLSHTLDQLITWAKSQPMDLKPQPGEAFGFAYNDPQEVPPEDFRFDLALTIPTNLKITGPVTERTLPAGRYAVATHKGSRKTIGDTIHQIYGPWLLASGEELGDLPCLFCYQNFDYEVPETESLTEIWVLLK